MDIDSNLTLRDNIVVQLIEVFRDICRFEDGCKWCKYHELCDLKDDFIRKMDTKIVKERRKYKWIKLWKKICALFADLL